MQDSTDLTAIILDENTLKKSNEKIDEIQSSFCLYFDNCISNFLMCCFICLK